MVQHTKLKGNKMQRSRRQRRNREEDGDIRMDTDGRMEGGRPATNEQGTERIQKGVEKTHKKGIRTSESVSMHCLF